MPLAALFLQPAPSFSFECSSRMYVGDSFDKPTRTFTPYDKIYVGVQCKQLMAGNYTVHVNWVHHQQGLVRTDSETFTLAEAAEKTIFFWFKLSRKGGLSSALTNQDFYEGHFGDWTVQSFLNNELVTEEPFTISY